MSRGTDPSVRPQPRRPHRRSPAADVAPGVDPDWAEAFLLELRLADVPGRHIGAALAEVASHCADSGETAGEAFGDPVEYARTLDLPAGPPTGPGTTDRIPGSAVPWVAQALALLVLAGAVPALVDGEPFTVTWGHLVAVALLAAPMVALGRSGSAVVAFVVRRPVIAWLAGMAHVGLVVAALLLFGGVVWRVPGPVAVGVSGAALLVTTGWLLSVLHREDFAEDPVTAPLADTRPSTRPGGGGVAAVVRYGPALLAPAAGTFLTAMTLLLT